MVKLFVVFTLCFYLCLQSTEAQADEPKVSFVGALKNFRMKGDISAKLDLKVLEGKSELYALGAYENLKGEIQIFDGAPYGTIVSGEKLVFDHSFEKKASLLVYTQVKSWREIPIPDFVDSQSKLELFLSDLGEQVGFAAEKPFPFLIKGKVRNLAWHIIDWNKEDTLHNHKKHIESGLNGELSDADVEILGFYSDHHKGIFTHHMTSVHMHFKTSDSSLAGHVDDLTPGKGMQLMLPKWD